MLKGFKDFLLRGNIIDLAIAVVVGTAFTALVTAFSKAIIEPLINRIGTGGGEHPGLKLSIGGGQYLDFGSLLTAGINFLIIAAVLYFLVVLPYKTLKDRLVKPEDAEKSEADLLAEIRDLLAGKKSATDPGQPTVADQGNAS